MPHLSGKQILDFEFRLPSVAEQDQIVDLISAYDDLIVNNLRRIRVLDGMVRAIYDQWFLATQTSRVLDGASGNLPEGWSLSELAAVCAGKLGIQTGPFGSQLHQEEYSEDGIPVVMPKDLVDFRINTERIARVPLPVADRLKRHQIESGDIVYGRRGEIGRRAYVMDEQRGWICGTGCLRLRADQDSVSSWFLFNYLGDAHVVQIIAGRAHGVTLPNLNARLMASVPVVLPPRPLQDAFERTTFPMAQLVEVLLRQNANLRATRDLLLPRLMAGRISLPDVEADLQAEVLGAGG